MSAPSEGAARPLIGITGRRFRLSLIQGSDERYGDRCIDTSMSDFAQRVAELCDNIASHIAVDGVGGGRSYWRTWGWLRI